MMVKGKISDENGCLSYASELVFESESDSVLAKEGMLVAKAFVNPSNGVIPLLVMNCSKPQSLHIKTVAATAEPVEHEIFTGYHRPIKKVNRKVQEEPRAKVAANPWHQEEEKKWHGIRWHQREWECKDCSDALGGTNRFSSIDRQSGYWQVAMLPQDATKTAFTCSSGPSQFKVLPFDCCNGPPTFQRLMDFLLSVLGKYAFCTLTMWLYSQRLSRNMFKILFSFDTSAWSWSEVCPNEMPLLSTPS